ncbi:MAG: HU family DNA-binding protein [bacterium]|nr:HU family DNA-binding protein [bacterium]
MNKKELVDAIVGRLNGNRKTVSDTLDAMESIVMDQLRQGNEVSLTGFGIFHVAVRKARAGVNPRNPQQKIQIPEVKVPKFRPGKTLKEAVRS